jgi:uncharacterized protein YyaL (SSP411 family)
LFYPALAQSPGGFVSLATALGEWLAPPSIVVLRGPADAAGEWQRALAATYRPDTLVIGLPGDLAQLPPALDKPAGTAVNAWLCRGVTCLPPIDDRGALEHALESASAVRGTRGFPG